MPKTTRFDLFGLTITKFGSWFEGKKQCFWKFLVVTPYFNRGFLADFGRFLPGFQVKSVTSQEGGVPRFQNTYQAFEFVIPQGNSAGWIILTGHLTWPTENVVLLLLLLSVGCGGCCCCCCCGGGGCCCCCCCCCCCWPSIEVLAKMVARPTLTGHNDGFSQHGPPKQPCPQLEGLKSWRFTSTLYILSFIFIAWPILDFDGSKHPRRRSSIFWRNATMPLGFSIWRVAVWFTTWAFPSSKTIMIPSCYFSTWPIVWDLSHVFLKIQFMI